MVRLISSWPLYSPSQRVKFLGRFPCAGSDGTPGQAVSPISVLIPTWRRPEDLRWCLLAIDRQTQPVDQVVVSHRVDDDQTRAVLDEFPHVESAQVPAGTNLVGSMNVGLAATTV